jgi:hypothetical protein
MTTNHDEVRHQYLLAWNQFNELLPMMHPDIDDPMEALLIFTGGFTAAYIDDEEIIDVIRETMRSLIRKHLDQKHNETNRRN